jgi:hypothetical protein
LIELLEWHREGGIDVGVGWLLIGIAADLLRVALGRGGRLLLFILHVAESFFALLAVLWLGVGVVGRILVLVFVVGILLILILLRRIGFVGGLLLVVLLLVLLVFVLLLLILVLIFFILILFLLIFVLIVGLFEEGGEFLAELGPVGGFGIEGGAGVDGGEGVVDGAGSDGLLLGLKTLAPRDGLSGEFSPVAA